MKKIWLNGCFDVLHYGHFQLIAHAVSLGGEVKIGIDSDKRIKESKGEDRPFHTQNQRISNLLQIQGVNGVVVFDSDKELSDLIKVYNPDIFVIGEEYKDKGIIGRKHAKEIVYFPKVEGLSTTKILNF